MKKLHALIWCVGMLSASAAVSMSPDVPAVSAGINEFTFDLFRAVAADAPGNLFCSPFSVSTALAMTYGGARGETARQMATALHFTLEPEFLHPAFGELARLVADLNQSDSQELAVANRLWIRKDFELLSSYTALVQKHYGAGLAPADFAADAEGARQEINAWVEKQTRDRIKDLVAPGMLTPETRLVLVNAIYFLGFWSEAFDPRWTQPQPFHRSEKDSADVPMMLRIGEYTCLDEAKFQLLVLPYKGEDLSMVVLLPRPGEDVRAMESTLTAEAVARWTRLARKQKVNVWLPRFRIESGFNLAETLGAMGMPEAFAGAADFSGMTGGKDLMIGPVIHKAFVEVNEKGTEAAAATAVVMKPASAMPTDRPLEFRADRPFVFLIRDNRTGTILFIGRLADPVAK